MKKNFILCTFMICVFGEKTFSQHTLYVSPGANFNMTSGTYVYVDGFVFNPTVNYNITGENSIRRDATTTAPPPTTNILRVYHFLQSLPGFSGTLTVYYQDAELNGVDESTLNLNLYNPTSWTVHSATLRDAINNFVATAGLTNVSFNEATLAADAALPVTLTNFIIQRDRCLATLKWTTVTEQNSSHFEIQQSLDGSFFMTVGIVRAAGNSNAEKHYSFDFNLSSTISFFRLRMVDIDGTIELSNIVRVTGNCSNSIIVFPNPAVNTITVQSEKTIEEIKLYNETGQLVQHLKPNNRTVSINLTQVPSGIYNVQVRSEQELRSIKIIRK